MKLPRRQGLDPWRKMSWRIPPSEQNQKLIEKHAQLPRRGISVVFASWISDIVGPVIDCCVSLITLFSNSNAFLWIFYHFIMDVWAGGVPSFRDKVEIYHKMTDL